MSMIILVFLFGAFDITMGPVRASYQRKSSDLKSTVKLYRNVCGPVSENVLVYEKALETFLNSINIQKYDKTTRSFDCNKRNCACRGEKYYEMTDLHLKHVFGSYRYNEWVWHIIKVALKVTDSAQICSISSCKRRIFNAIRLLNLAKKHILRLALCFLSSDNTHIKIEKTLKLLNMNENKINRTNNYWKLIKWVGNEIQKEYEKLINKQRNAEIEINKISKVESIYYEKQTMIVNMSADFPNQKLYYDSIIAYNIKPNLIRLHNFKSKLNKSKEEINKDIDMSLLLQPLLIKEILLLHCRYFTRNASLKVKKLSLIRLASMLPYSVFEGMSVLEKTELWDALKYMLKSLNFQILNMNCGISKLKCDRLSAIKTIQAGKGICGCNFTNFSGFWLHIGSTTYEILGGRGTEFMKMFWMTLKRALISQNCKQLVVTLSNLNSEKKFGLKLHRLMPDWTISLNFGPQVVKNVARIRNDLDIRKLRNNNLVLYKNDSKKHRISEHAITIRAFWKHASLCRIDNLLEVLPHYTYVKEYKVYYKHIQTASTMLKEMQKLKPSSLVINAFYSAFIDSKLRQTLYDRRFHIILQHILTVLKPDVKQQHYIDSLTVISKFCLPEELIKSITNANAKQINITCYCMGDRQCKFGLVCSETCI